MRDLNLYELETRFDELAYEVEYVEFKFQYTRLNQFIEFLLNQPISKRILQRIEEDFSDVGKIPDLDKNDWDKQRRLYKESITDPEKQGAFGYFLIIGTYNSDKVKFDSAYFNLANFWYAGGSGYSEMQKIFNDNFFKPMTRLIRWYITDSQSYNSLDYFSKVEITDMEDRLVSMEEKLTNLGYGQEIIFNEIQELKDLLPNLKKKNWFEILRGKFGDSILSKVVSVETVGSIYETITGDKLNILNS